MEEMVYGAVVGGLVGFALGVRWAVGKMRKHTRRVVEVRGEALAHETETEAVNIIVAMSRAKNEEEVRLVYEQSERFRSRGSLHGVMLMIGFRLWERMKEQSKGS